MSKIKDILEKMRTTGNEYHILRLLIAKRVWLIIVTLYYLSYLFTVGGYYFSFLSIEDLSMITFHLFSILVIATAWFLYSLCEYAVNIYMPNRKWLLIFPIILGILFTSLALLVHLGFIGKI